MDGSSSIGLGVYGHGAEWSPDGQHIVFTKDYDIHRMDRDGENIMNLTEDTGTSESWPKWSSDGQRILYTSQGGLWVMNADGSGKSRIPTEGNCGYGEWSPDDSLIAYTYNYGGRYCVFIMNSDGTDIRQLTPVDAEGSGDYEVTWSPDGQSLLFMRLYIRPNPEDESTPIYDNDLCLLDLDSGVVTYLTTGPDSDLCPSWKRVRKSSTNDSNILGY